MNQKQLKDLDYQEKDNYFIKEFTKGENLSQKTIQFYRLDDLVMVNEANFVKSFQITKEELEAMYMEGKKIGWYE